MEEKMKSEKIPYQLGLPPMELAEKSVEDVSNVSDDNTPDVFENASDEKIQKVREVLLNQDIPCDKNPEGICKNLVTTIKTILQEDTGLKTVMEEFADQKTSSTVKRQTVSLADLESLKPTPDLPFEAKESYGYVPDSLPVPVLPAPLLPGPLLPGPVVPYGPPPVPYGPPPGLPTASSCLLAKLLKLNPHVLHGIPDYAPPHYENHQIPYSRHAQNTLHNQIFQSRVADPPRNIIHHQDAEIMMSFLNPGPKDRSSNSSARDADCAPGNVSCGNGERCILESQWCDGKVDCSDVSDESRCSCKARVDKTRLCDGYFDCPFGEDEMGCFGCSETAFSCIDLDVNSQSTCFTKEQRCNNIVDCPNRRDELDCTMLAPTLHKTPIYAVSNTEGFLHRNFKGDWYAVCKNPYMWAHDACRRETGLIIRPPYIQVIPIDPMLEVNYLNTAEGGMIHMSDTCFNNSAIYVTCPDLLCGTRIMPATQILKENVEIENHLFGRNKRFLESYPLYYSDRERRHVMDIINERNNNSLYLEKEIMDSSNLRNKRTESRVVGGIASQPAAWPWMIAMYRDGMFHCGGVVLTQTWVMSAAHCVSSFWEHYYEIRVGMLRRFSFSPQESNHKITHIIVNKFYSKEDMKNDVSLLRVEPAIQFSRWVRPICLPGLETAGADWLWGPPAGTKCTTVGWGATVEHGPDPDHMREVEVPIWSHCKHREDRAGKEICAGFNEGRKDACQGDSGGPLLCKNPRNPQQWYMAGIVSHGDGCGRVGEPGVYTRVSLFVKWIRYHIFSESLPSRRPKQECPGFRCVSGMAKCLAPKRVCDKIVDCLGGEDEINCSSRSLTQFDNLFLSSQTEDSFSSFENFLSKKSMETEETQQNMTKQSEATNNSHEVKSAKSSEINIENVITTDMVQKSVANVNGISSVRSAENITGTDFSQASTLEMPNEKSTESDELESADTVDPFAVTSDESNTNARDDISDSISITKFTNPMKDIDSLVKINNERDVDIQENFEIELPSTASTVKLHTNSVANEPITENKDLLEHSSTQNPSSVEIETEKSHFDQAEPQTTSVTETSHHLHITESTIADKTTKIMSTDFSNSQTTLLPDIADKPISDNDIAETKDLLIALPDSEPTSHPTGATEQDANTKITSDLENNQKLDTFNNIISTKLVPAKLKRQHHPPKEFSCRHLPQIIPYHLRCDRKADCEDGTDELSCTCVDYISTFEPRLLCDGFFDCAGGEDEINCFSCPEDHFLCKKSQQCVPLKHVCDEKPDCPMGEDELECFSLTNGANQEFGLDGTPEINLQGYITKKHDRNWQVVCDENLTTEQQELAAGHICRYLGFSSANRYQVKHINVGEKMLKSSSVEDTRSRRNIEGGVPVNFVYRQVDETARNIVIKEPQVLKEQCLPNVTKTCMSLYVYCDHALYTDNFDLSNEILYSREARDRTRSWPWVAKVFVDGDYRCSGVLVDLSWVLVSHSCLWDTFNMQDETSEMCLAIGQDEHNTTYGLFLQETNKDCDLHNRCYVRIPKDDSCQAAGNHVKRMWAGVISCHTEQGWYPAATFEDSRGECGVGNRIVASPIGSYKNSIKHFNVSSGRSASESNEVTSALNCEGVRCGRGKCIKLAQVCDGVPECEDQNDENEDACQMKNNICTKHPYHRGCECSSGQFKCHNGKCLAKELFKDGRDDCGDASDEPEQMSCAHYLARVKPSRLCDGILHCKDRSDENPMFCKCFAKRGYRCDKAPSDVDLCVSHDVVCDGVEDCPSGEDEKTCLGLHAPEGTKYGTGQVMQRSHGVWFTKCFSTQNHTRSGLEAICRDLGFIGGHAKQLEPPANFSKRTKFMIDQFSEVMLNNNTSITIRNTNEPLARTTPGESVENCYPVYIECL
ncbi:trypsin domain-containing protein [Phthorimaea operculella]|nr:trypsin domain-containing protein [Phthorimaea operculella]